MEISSLNCIDKIIEQIGQLECFPRVLSRLALGEHYFIWNLLVRCILTFITTALTIKLNGSIMGIWSGWWFGEKHVIDFAERYIQQLQ